MLKADPFFEYAQTTEVAYLDCRGSAFLPVLAVDDPVDLEDFRLRSAIGDELVGSGVLADLDLARKLSSAL